MTNNQNTKDISAITKDVAVILTKVGRMETDFSNLNEKLDSNYATKEWCESRFGQTTKQVNAIFITFGMAIITALAAFVIKGGLIK